MSNLESNLINWLLDRKNRDYLFSFNPNAIPLYEILINLELMDKEKFMFKTKIGVF